jgi:hypothetical protein
MLIERAAQVSRGLTEFGKSFTQLPRKLRQLLGAENHQRYKEDDN